MSDPGELSLPIYPEIGSQNLWQPERVTSWPLIIAHRGASGYLPEHSRGAYELAIIQGAGAVEPDVVMSSDGVLVIRHENNLAATTDVSSRIEFASRHRTKLIDGAVVAGWFTEDFTWDELQTLHCVEPHPQMRVESAQAPKQPVLRLAELLQVIDAAERPVRVVVEFKSPTYFESLGFNMEDAFVREIELAGWKRNDKRLIIESFESSILKRAREVGLGYQHIYLIDEVGTAPDQRLLLGDKALTYSEQRRMESLRSLGKFLDGISVSVGLFNSDEGANLVALCHDLGLKVFCWTLRAENKYLPSQWRRGFDLKAWGDWQPYFESIVATGVDGVFTDQPDLLVRLRDGVSDQP